MPRTLSTFAVQRTITTRAWRRCTAADLCGNTRGTPRRGGVVTARYRLTHPPPRYAADLHKRSRTSPAVILRHVLQAAFNPRVQGSSPWRPTAFSQVRGGDGDTPDPDADPDRYLSIPNEGSREMAGHADFALDVEDEAVRGQREQLLDAIDGRGAFSRFKRAPDRHDDLRAGWHSYSEECRAGRARDWLAGQGFAVLPPCRWSGAPRRGMPSARQPPPA